MAAAALPGPARGIRRVLMASVVLAVLGGCASFTAMDADQAFSDSPEAVELTDVPWFPQEALQCGPAALAEMLGWSGYTTTPHALEGALFIPAREGTLQTEILAQARTRNRVPYRIPGTYDALMDELRAGHPVMVFQNLGLAWLPVWHYAVLVGYDPTDQAFILRSGVHERHHSPLDRFRRTWERGDHWAVVIMPPDRLPATAEATPWLRAAHDLESTGRPHAAEIAYRTGLERWPDHGGLHVALVNLLHARGDAGAAEAAARRGLDQTESRRDVLRNNLAMLLLERGACDEAEELARDAVADADGPFAENFRRTLENIQERRDNDDGCD